MHSKIEGKCAIIHRWSSFNSIVITNVRCCSRASSICGTNFSSLIHNQSLELSLAERLWNFVAKVLCKVFSVSKNWCQSTTCSHNSSSSAPRREDILLFLLVVTCHARWYTIFNKIKFNPCRDTLRNSFRAAWKKRRCQTIFHHFISSNSREGVESRRIYLAWMMRSNGFVVVLVNA